jgi:hypothetical protein
LPEGYRDRLPRASDQILFKTCPFRCRRRAQNKPAICRLACSSVAV